MQQFQEADRFGEVRFQGIGDPPAAKIRERSSESNFRIAREGIADVPYPVEVEVLVCGDGFLQGLEDSVPAC